MIRRKPKTAQETFMHLLSKKDLHNIREMALFILKDKRDFLDKTVAEVWTEAVIHQLLKKGLMRPLEDSEL